MKTYTFDFSRFNRLYVATFIFVLCLLMGVNVNFDHFDRLTQLPEDRNETFFIKNITVTNKDNILHFSFKIDYIFTITFKHFFEHLKIDIISAQNSANYNQYNFHNQRSTKNYYNFSIICPFEGDIFISLAYYSKHFRSFSLKINNISTKSLTSINTASNELSNFCFSENKVIYNHPGSLVLAAFSSVTQVTRISNFDNPNYTIGKQTIFVPKITSKPLDVLFNALLPTFDYRIQVPNQKFYFYDNFNNKYLRKLVSILPSIEVIDAKSEICFETVKLFSYENYNLSSFQSLLNISESGHRMIIGVSDYFMKLKNSQEYFVSKSQGKEIVYIFDEMDISFLIAYLKDASEFIISDQKQIVLLSCIPKSCKVYYIKKPQEDVNWISELSTRFNISIQIINTFEQTQNDIYLLN